MSIHVQIVFMFLLTFVVVFALLARRLAIPYPIVLVIAGLLLGFAPGLPKIALDPQVIFLIVLPPLLYSAAWWTSWREFSYNLIPIALQQLLPRPRIARRDDAGLEPARDPGARALEHGRIDSQPLGDQAVQRDAALLCQLVHVPDHGPRLACP